MARLLNHDRRLANVQRILINPSSQHITRHAAPWKIDYAAPPQRGAAFPRGPLREMSLFVVVLAWSSHWLRTVLPCGRVGIHTGASGIHRCAPAQ